MDWSVDPLVAETFGSDGPWVRHLAAAWQAVAGQGLDRLPPDPSPLPGSVGEPDTGGLDLESLIAYWSPLIHLVGYGLGWAYPERGLARWYRSRGRVRDPLLALISQWWGRKRIRDFLLWGGFAEGLPGAAQPLLPPVSWSNADDRNRRNALDWQMVWATGSDPMHLFGAPSWLPAEPPTLPAHLVRSSPQIEGGAPVHSQRKVLLARETYAGWYSELDSVGRDFDGRDQVPVIDVYVDTIGFLGTYQRHEATQRWFRGCADVHLWGN